MKHLITIPANVVSRFHSIADLKKEDWFVCSDPAGQKVGSGGGTAHILSELFKAEKATDFDTWLQKEKRIIIHAGGQSRRLPAYAPVGKSLIPIPVFRWSRGQHLNQRLVHLQYPLFDKLLENAPEKLNTLVASGDTLIFPGHQLPGIPEADIVCFGLWLEPEKATHHGVFFLQHENPAELEFMLQKPTISEIQKLVHRYFFLMDIGIWLLSDKAVKILMKNCGWENGQYKNQQPEYYDLYGEFGPALGNSPRYRNNEISELAVSVVNLGEGGFYHFGNTSELVTSMLNIQNRVHDPREIWHKHVKPHASVFVLNSEKQNNFTPAHQNIWIENSVIPNSWSLTQNHVLTGIFPNSWSLKLPPGVCLDFIPLDNERTIIRNHGFSDKFRGAWKAESTRLMEEPLLHWLNKRQLSAILSSLAEDTDIFDLPLFPVLDKKEISEGFIQWLIAKNPDSEAGYTSLWEKSRRLSCYQINESGNIGLLEESRKSHQLKNFVALANNYRQSVFYQLDLKKTASVFAENKLDLPEPVSSELNDWTPIHDNMFRAQYYRHLNQDGSAFEKVAFRYLRDQLVNIYKQNKVSPKINLLPDQIAWGRSPVRLDLAGGWTDTPPYCFLYGGKVVNVAVELNGQPPLHCYIKRNDHNQIVLRSIDLGAHETIRTWEDIRSFEDIQSAFSIPKAALALCGFLPEFSAKIYPSLAEQLENSGGGLEISILSAVPKGSGLGTSSILAATVLGTLAEVCGLNQDKQEIGRRTLALEQLLTTGGGWQDQFGGLFEGIKFFETNTGRLQNPAIKWLPESFFSDPVFKKRILLYYTGITRVAKNILGEIVRGMFLNSGEHLSVLKELKQHAANTWDVMLKKDFQAFARMIEKSWQLNQQIDSGTNTPEIQALTDSIKPWLAGQKLLGAGGGGFMLLVAKDEEAAIKIRKKLTENPVNPNGRFVDFELSKTGFQVTKS